MGTSRALEAIAKVTMSLDFDTITFLHLLWFLNLKKKNKQQQQIYSTAMFYTFLKYIMFS